MTDLGLEDFLRAADQGPLVWVEEDAGLLTVCGGPKPVLPSCQDVGKLFVMALRDHFGTAASDIAERELGLDEKRSHPLPARSILRAVACAESALTLLMAQATVLRFEFSAELLGWRFNQLCWELAIAPKALSVERRQAIDAAMSAYFSGVAPPTPETAHDMLRAMLTQGLH